MKVTVRNWAKLGMGTDELLAMLRDDQSLRHDLARANVITLSIGWDHIDLIGYGAYAMSACARGKGLDMACIKAGVTKLERNLDAILAEIAALRDPSDALIRVMDQPNPFLSDWKQRGIFDELKTPACDEWNYQLAQSAARRKMTVVHAYRALNGPNGDQETPAEYVYTDGLHFNEAGQAFLAELHRQAGYDLAAP